MKKKALLVGKDELKYSLSGIEWLEFYKINIDNIFAIKNGQYDIIIIQIFTEETLEIIKKIREIDNRVLIFVVSEYLSLVLDKHFLQSGVDDFVVKPYDSNFLISKIFLLFSRTERLKQLNIQIDVKYENKLVELKKNQEKIRKFIDNMLIDKNFK